MNYSFIFRIHIIHHVEGVKHCIKLYIKTKLDELSKKINFVNMTSVNIKYKIGIVLKFRILFISKYNINGYFHSSTNHILWFTKKY